MLSSANLASAATALSALKKTRSELAQAVHGTSPISFKDVSYLQLKHDMALALDGRYICCGSTREMILLDMKSDVLNEYFEHFLDCMESEEALTEPDDSDDESQPLAEQKNIIAKKIPELLQVIVSYVAHVFFEKSNNIPAQEKINALIEKSQPGVPEKYKAIIPLEYFVKEKTGVCRHAALLTGYLLRRLIGHLNPDSHEKVYRFRSDLILTKHSSLYRSGLVPHAVVVYVSEEGHQYLLDSTRTGQGMHGMVMDITKLNSDKNQILEMQYPSFNILKFIETIGTSYPGFIPSVKPAGVGGSI